MEIAALVKKLSKGRKMSDEDINRLLPILAAKKENISEEEARSLIKIMTHLFVRACEQAGHSEKGIRALTTKFRDAGRRSAPWRPTSSRVPGRPQDGSDGNRISRWRLPADHKFYATEVDATLVEVKYILQSLSMQGAPIVSIDIHDCFTPWLIENKIVPGSYLDPVQMVPIKFQDFIDDPRSVQSGHIIPLDRDGRHVPKNTFLMLYRSNQIQGNLKVSELLQLMRDIIKRHDEAARSGSQTESLIRQE